MRFMAKDGTVFILGYNVRVRRNWLTLRWKGIVEYYDFLPPPERRFTTRAHWRKRDAKLEARQWLREHQVEIRLKKLTEGYVTKANPEDRITVTVMPTAKMPGCIDWDVGDDHFFAVRRGNQTLCAEFPGRVLIEYNVKLCGAVETQDPKEAE